MYGKIVAGYDESEEGRDALALAALVAEATGGVLLIGYVSPHQPRWYGNERNYRRALRDEVASILHPAAASMPASVRVETTSLAASSPSRGLHDLAEDEGAGLLVLGSTHRGPVGRVLLGSVGELLLMAAPCAVAVAPRRFAARSSRSIGVVGAGFDGSAESEQALASAHALAGASGARLRAIAVADSRHFPRASSSRPAGSRGKAEHAELERQLDEALSRLDPQAERLVLSGQPDQALAAAGAEIDLLVVGSRGYGPIRRALLGSVSAKLMRSAPCPSCRARPTPWRNHGPKPPQPAASP